MDDMMSYNSNVVEDFVVEAGRPPDHPAVNLSSSSSHSYHGLSLSHSQLLLQQSYERSQALSAVGPYNTYQSMQHAEYRDIEPRPVRKNKPDTSFACNLCFEEFRSKQELRGHKKVAHKKRFTCDECSKDFTCKLTLIGHVMRIHNNIREKFPCHMCTKEYGSKQYLITHITTAHNKKHKCNLCPNEYISESFLMLHMNREHIKTKGRTYPCTSCSNEYATKKFLQKHMKEHEQVFQCSLCFKQFGSKLLIEKHIEKTHPDTFAPPQAPLLQTFQCNVCSERFRSDEFLQQHMQKKHSEYGETNGTDSGNTNVETENSDAHVSNLKEPKIEESVDDRERSDDREGKIDIKRRKRKTNASIKTEIHTEESADSEGENSESDDNKEEITLEDNSSEEEEEEETDIPKKKTRSSALSLRAVSNTKQTKYSCNLCDKIYDDFDSLKEHMKIIHQKRLYGCPYCSKTYYGHFGYREHVKTVHEGIVYECPYKKSCPNFTSKAGLQRHVDGRHKGIKRKYACTDCNKVFTSPTGLNLHRKANHGDSVTYKCSECPKAFRQRQGLRAHIGKFHEGAVFQCELCSKTFGYKSSYLIHMRGHNKVKCDQCGDTFTTESELKHHMLSHEAITYTCSLCKKSFPSKSLFTSHKGSHTKTAVLGYKCSLCRNEYNSLPKILTHFNTTHGPRQWKPKSRASSERYDCSQCSKTFAQKHGLRGHILSVHEGRLFECSLCFKTFSHRVSLRMHMKTFHNTMGTQCGECGKVFLNPNLLVAHMQETHPGTEMQQRAAAALEKPTYPCIQCGDRFPSLEQVREHATRVHDTGAGKTPTSPFIQVGKQEVVTWDGS